MGAARRTIVHIVRIRPVNPIRIRRTARPAPADAAATAPVQPRPDGNAAPAATPRRRPSRRSVIITALLALAAGAAAALLLTMPSIEQAGSTTLTRDATPVLDIQVDRPMGVLAANVDATIDGRPLPTSAIRIADGGALVQLRAPRLADGEHEVRVEIAKVGVLRRTLTAGWSFTVDTIPPTAKVVEPAGARNAGNPYAASGVAVVTALPLRTSIELEPGSTMRVFSTRGTTDSVTVEASDDATRTVELDLPQGAQAIVVSARDAAGNVAEFRRRVLVDTAGPAITVRAPRVVKDATLALPLTARDPHGVDLQVLLDGNVLEDAVAVSSTTEAPNADGTGSDSGNAAPTAGDAGEAQPGSDDEGDDGDLDSPLPIALSSRIVLDDRAYEGRHALEVVATDSLGKRRSLKRTVFVDSVESLADASGLRSGARGRDVVELHDALVKAEAATRAQLAADARTRTYGAATRDAVTRFQNARGVAADGIAGSETIAALTMRIVIDRSATTLTLFRLGDVVKTYRIAVGSPEFPTPAGDFEIVNMQENPTWTPPDSEWAKDAEVTPPGPDNPLGTRWMGIGGTIGIHGTNSPASIGYSVSHGCIRMRIPEVEELFEMVQVGTPVTVV